MNHFEIFITQNLIKMQPKLLIVVWLINNIMLMIKLIYIYIQNTQVCDFRFHFASTAFSSQLCNVMYFAAD